MRDDPDLSDVVQNRLFFARHLALTHFVRLWAENAGVLSPHVEVHWHMAEGVDAPVEHLVEATASYMMVVLLVLCYLVVYSI